MLNVDNNIKNMPTETIDVIAKDINNGKIL